MAVIVQEPEEEVDGAGDLLGGVGVPAGHGVEDGQLPVVWSVRLDLEAVDGELDVVVVGICLVLDPLRCGDELLHCTAFRSVVVRA